MKFDIMMPFYGRFDHFQQAVESVRAQSDPDWRMVIVDDVYPDLAPGEWACGLGDDRITYIRNQENLGPSRNYRKCVSLMQSEFAVIMGCDDIMLPNFVRRTKELIDEFPDSSIIQCGVSVIDTDGRPILPLADRAKSWYQFRGRGAREYSGPVLATSLMRGNWTYFPSLVWRASELRKHGFRVDLDVVQDLAMLAEIVKGGGSLVLDDEVTFNYRRHSASVSAMTGPDGSKFAQERTLFTESSRDFSTMGWTGASLAARIHFTSRMNALSELPAAVRSGNAQGRQALLRHVFGK
ncbi:glycosyltransferase family 2 protein [Cryobacterium sp. TMT1-21]|uniref:glycosyltransferase family 2 protein n=1 Tax=Cryobacterium sp. TMT1-21 TaxID=1259234 RepID=UPI0018E0B3F5|nr:glycosyltransferase family 2 protein [Cryobacterium sp. TMT1-21]